MHEILESDWKVFKRLRPVALERFCERVLGDIARISADAGQSHHQRYLEIFRLIEVRDQQIVEIFDHLRRSTAIQQLLQFRSHQLLSAEELSGLSPELRALLTAFAPGEDE
jgi:hypothetical protein